MSDISYFVLRWSFPKSEMVEGLSIPAVNVGGFEWKPELRAHGPTIPFSSSTFYFVLGCDTEMKGTTTWSAETHIDYSFYDGATELCTRKTEKTFNNDAKLHGIISVYGGTNIMNSSFAQAYPFAYRDDTTLTFECRVKIIQPVVTPVIDVSKFLSPNEHGNVTLVLGSEKLRVSREMLAYRSPVLAALFFQNFAEKNKDEIELKDVDYNEFVDLMSLLFTICAQITDDASVLHILPLADRFQIMQVIEVVEKHLLNSNNVFFAEKLLLADMYRLQSLKEFCLHKNRIAELKTIKDTQEFAQLSQSMQEEVAKLLNGV